MKKSRLLDKVLLCTIVLFTTNTSEAAPVLLDSMVITVNSGGSTIGSAWPGTQSFSGTMTVPTGTSIDYFLVELTNFQVTPHTPLETILEYIDSSGYNGDVSPKVEKMTFFGNGANIVIGETLLADGTTYYKGNSNVPVTSDGIYDIFSTFVNGPGLQPPWRALNLTGFSSAVDSPHIYLEFTVGAYGEVSAIPIPASVWLFGSGLLGLIGMARRNKT